MKVFNNIALREIRKAKGFTQKRLAEAIGTVECHVQHWEYGLKAPSADYLLRIMLELGCAPEELSIDKGDNTLK
ncbi:MAG: helix-turn-helix transcriptional regulator [Clostridia bacterium]|nr:helix-turn-helix transcriptional regulator [Clostridia bacterium]